jgi:2-oxoglutarate dehydrogenase E1 component
MLRHPAAISPLADFAMPSSFKPVITRWPQNGVIPDRVVFCSGKIAYDVEHEAASRGSERTAVVRIEQLHPFPHTALLSLLRPWHEAHFTWLQEEPANAGARDYILPRLTETLTVAGAPSPNVVCVCRAASGSPAGSFHGWHDQDQAELVSRALR